MGGVHRTIGTEGGSGLEELKYPIGRFSAQDRRTRAQRIADIEDLPFRIREAVEGLDGPKLDTPYRDGGWTVRQLVHHVADSHTNGFTRLKLALTENVPTVKPYDEVEWAKLPDCHAPIGLSLTILDGIHARWHRVLREMTEAQFQRRFFHPDHGENDLDWLLANYAWHSRHHTAHITRLRTRMGW